MTAAKSSDFQAAKDPQFGKALLGGASSLARLAAMLEEPARCWRIFAGLRRPFFGSPKNGFRAVWADLRGVRLSQGSVVFKGKPPPPAPTPNWWLFFYFWLNATNRAPFKKDTPLPYQSLRKGAGVLPCISFLSRDYRRLQKYVDISGQTNSICCTSGSPSVWQANEQNIWTKSIVGTYEPCPLLWAPGPTICDGLVVVSCAISHVV